MAGTTFVIGGGAREHALLWALRQSPLTSDLLCAPGNAGTAQLAENVPLAVEELDAIVRLATERRVDLCVVGPEKPLAMGLADRLRAAGIPTAGPSQAAARLESSKVWAKDLMRRAGVPTARFTVVTDLADARRALSDYDLPVVIKADGLAAGKGVVVAQSREEAEAALTSFLETGTLGAAGHIVVIEECLSGPEVSVLALTDGEEIRTLVPACDHKRVFDGDAGPNTGGMGAYAPTRLLSMDDITDVERTVLRPVIDRLRADSTPLVGVLYAGLMLTPDGPRVLEFNVRFGDPETQVVLPMLDGDLAALLRATAEGRLGELPAPNVRAGACVGVVLASGGYPGSYETGEPITGLDAVPSDALVFHAGTRRDASGAVVTDGGRVLTVVAPGETLAAARKSAYGAVDRIHFDGMHVRRDIGLREVGA